VGRAAQKVNPWAEILVYFGTLAIGIVTNFLIAAYYAGKYKERVERLTEEVNRYEDRVEKMERALSALSGTANGVNYPRLRRTTD
jgi:hypothetical protein